jgi:hypothetical protein
MKPSIKGDGTMRLFSELMTTDAGLMSAAGILFMLGMVVFYFRFFMKHMHDDEVSALQRKP